MASELREGATSLAGARQAYNDQADTILGPRRQDRRGRPYSDGRLAVEFLHSASPQPLGTCTAAKAPGSGLPLTAGCERGPPPECLLRCLQAQTPNAAGASSLGHDPPSATFHTCPSFLAGDNTTRKTEPGQPVLTVTLQPGQAPPRTAPRQPGKRPPETAGAAASRLRVRRLGRPWAGAAVLRRLQAPAPE